MKADGRQVPYSISLLHIPRNNRIAEGVLSGADADVRARLGEMKVAPVTAEMVSEASLRSQ